MFLTPIYTPFRVLNIHLHTHLCSQHPSTQSSVLFSTPKSRYTKCYQIPEISLELLLVISPLAHTWMPSISTSRLSSLIFFFKERFIHFYFTTMGVLLPGTSVHHVHACCLQRLEEGIGLPRTGIMCGCESPCGW